MSTPVRVVVVGCGDISETAHLPAVARSSAADLVAVVDVDAERRALAAARYGVAGFASIEAAMATDPQASIIATPPDVTPGVCEQALACGLHVLFEKPMATDIAAARRVHDAAVASGRIVQAGFTNRFSPLVVAVREAIAAGRLGSPLVFTLGAYDERFDPADHRHLARMTHFLTQAPAFVHEGAHLVDYVAYLTGARPTRVAAVGRRTSAQFPSENFVAATVEWDNGDLARLEVGWLFPALPGGHFRVLGPRATAEIFRREGRLVINDGRERDELRLDDEWATVSFDRQLAHFLAAVRGTATPGPTTADGLAGLELTEAIVRAMREHTVIDLAEQRVGNAPRIVAR